MAEDEKRQNALALLWLIEEALEDFPVETLTRIGYYKLLLTIDNGQLSGSRSEEEREQDKKEIEETRNFVFKEFSELLAEQNIQVSEIEDRRNYSSQPPWQEFTLSWERK